MIRVLITGANSYIGSNVEKWFSKKPNEFEVETLDVKNPNWIEKNFVGYNVIFHVAGIVHQKEKKYMKKTYFKVNRDLAYQIAEKAKKENVNQFIFMSSMSVYGLSQGKININTAPNPISYYGKSKFEAEKSILKLSNKRFIVSILRAPIIYGKNSPGNFSKIVKYSKYLLFFPNTLNSRSMLYIKNFCIILEQVVLDKLENYIYPENKEKVNTFEIVKELRLQYGKKTINMYFLSFMIKIFGIFFHDIKKIFGSLFYEIEHKYNFSKLISFRKSIVEMVEDNE